MMPMGSSRNRREPYVAGNNALTGHDSPTGRMLGYKSLSFVEAPNLKLAARCVTTLFQQRLSFGTARRGAARHRHGAGAGGPVMIGPPIDGRPVPCGSCGVVWREGEVKLVTQRAGISSELWVRNPGVTSCCYGLSEVNRDRLKDGWSKTGESDSPRCFS
jgi:hypothetical protein